MKYKTCRRHYKSLKKYRDFRILIWLGIGCFIAFGLFLLLTNVIFCKPNEFGDSAGATNGLFSALAFAGVIYAIFLQKDELSLQRQELKNTRKEIAGQKREFQMQNKTLKHQRFENTFFQMLNLHQEIVRGLSYSFEKECRKMDSEGKQEVYYEQRTVNGREIFHFTFEKVVINNETASLMGMRGLLMYEKIKGYELSDIPTYYDHYFRNLYRIIKFVHESPLIQGFEERYQYTSIVRGQLSRYELIWLYYNCLSEYGNEYFKPLIERYALLKNIRKDLLIEDDSIGSYSKSAYMEICPSDADR